jgi:hypothetical protein
VNELSVIVPAYNATATLRECVGSILAQSLAPAQIIIADDCSTDGTQQLIESLANEHRAIRPILRPNNVGVAANRDLAIREASSPLISQIDADDTMGRDKLAAEVEILRRRADAVAMSDYEVLNPEVAAHPMRRSVAAYSDIGRAELILKLARRDNPIPRDMTFSRDLYLDAGGYRHAYRLYEDWEFKLRLAGASGPWIATQVTGTRYTRLSSGLSRAPLGRHAFWRTRALLDNLDGPLAELTVEDFSACLVDALELEQFVEPAGTPIGEDAIDALGSLCEQRPDAAGLEGPRASCSPGSPPTRLGQTAFGERIEEILVAHGVANRLPPHSPQGGIIAAMKRLLGRPVGDAQ